MPAYSFKERFVPLIKSETKNQTIRGKRKGQAKPGDTLYLYFGMRTKWCTKIGEATCSEVFDIKILATGVWVNNKLLNDDEMEALAKADGFENFDVMHRWWAQTNGLPFIGDIIYWKNFEPCK